MTGAGTALADWDHGPSAEVRIVGFLFGSFQQRQ